MIYFVDGSINAWVVTSIAKICAQIGFLPDRTREELEKQLASLNNLETKQVFTLISAI